MSQAFYHSTTPPRAGIWYLVPRRTISTCYIIEGCVPLGGVVYFESRDNQKRFLIQEVRDMKWEKPSYNDLRFGFEVTMYIYNR